MQLFRAIAYRLERANTPPSASWPDMTVFFEATDRGAAAASLQPLLAALWACRPSDIEFYNLADETELLSSGNFASDAMGDAALLVNGWSHGPLFCRADRTLMLVTPPTLGRLIAARAAARPFHMQQRAQADLAAELARADQVRRAMRMHERMEGAHATGFGSL